MFKKSKAFISIILAVVMALSFGACGKKNDTKQEGKLPTGKTLRAWTRLTPAENEVLKGYLKEWETKTGNKVEFTLINMSNSELIKVANSDQRPDVIWGLSNGHTGVYARSGVIEEIPEGIFDKSKIISNTLIDAVSYDGKVYGVPLFAETYALFYNKDKVKEAPKTWEDLMKLGKENGFEYDLTNFYYSFYPVATAGGYIFKEEAGGKFDVNNIGLANEGAVKGLELIKGLVDNKLMTPSVTGDIAKNHFKEGKTALFIGGPWDVADMDKAKLNYGIAVLPSINGTPGKSMLGMQTGYVLKKSANKELAWDLVKDLSNESKIEALMKAGNRLPAYNSMQLPDAKLQGFVDQLQNSVVKPIVPEMTLVWDPMKATLQSVVSGSKTPADAAKFGADGIKQKIDITK